ncbi:type IV pilus assembly protein PilM [Psychrobium sp. nBUS_13]|jgi:type IV pilus assembly protein PilM|uniref:type IV pilus assembly protein PilM n=1 Tax=Psychrobium sp. nBUS_13 TaxID=3395319 RepID=UPI003EBD2841
MLSGLLKPKTTKMIGVDIGSSSVKAVLLNRSNNGYKVENVAHFPISRGFVVDNAITDLQGVGEVIKKVKKKFSKSGADHAAAAVSGSGVIIKTIYMNAVRNDEELESQIEIEAENLIPYPLDEVSLDFEILGENAVNNEKVDVLLVAARSELVQARSQALEIGKLQAKVIDVEGYALGRTFELIEHQVSDTEKEQAVALIDVGAAMLTIAVVKDGKTVFIKEQAFGGEQYTQSIVAYYGMDNYEAEQAKLSGELPRNYVFEVFAPFQTALAQQIKRMIQMYSSANDNNQVSKIILSGGCTNIEGIDVAISEEISISCVLAQPFLHCEVRKSIDFDALNREGAQYMMATGLALRNFK